MELPHVGGIDKSQNAVLAGSRYQRAAGNRHGAARAQIHVGTVQSRLVERGEVVHSRQPPCGTDFYETVAIVTSRAVRIEGAVAGHDVDVAADSQQSLTAPPNASVGAVGRRVEHRDLLKIGGVVPQQPAMPGGYFPDRAESSVDHAVHEEQPRTVPLMHRIEDHRPVHVVDPASLHPGGNFHWATELFNPGDQIESVQPVMIGAALFGLGDDIHGVAAGIDDRRAGYAVLEVGVLVRAGRIGSDDANIVDGHRRPEVHLPEGLRHARVIGIESVHAVVFGGGEDHVARNPPDGEARDIERLRIHLAVHRM